jgi:ABC-type polysaccharide/polyol phosphate transport system ATPase subunit
MAATDVPAIRVRGLGRYFGPRAEMDGAVNPREAFRTLMRIAGVPVRAGDDRSSVTFAVAGHVLRDLSFDVEWGSVVCLAGPSGSGKTVLLQLMAGALPPTTGRIEFYGPVTSLLATGDNLDSRSTAIENLKASPYVTAATPDETARYIDDVLDFAELREFEHASIRTYSTGMVLRLSIAMALCGRPSIVLIDDVLNVGDIGFQQKCLDRVLALKDAGCTLVLALSDEAFIQRIATRVLTLGDGGIVSDAPPLHGLAPQQGRVADVSWQVMRNLPEDAVMALRVVEVVAGDGGRGAVELRATFEPKVAGLRCRPLLTVAAVGGRSVLFRSLYPEYVDVPGTAPLHFAVPIPVETLPNGDYTIGFHIVSIKGASTDAGNVLALKATEVVKLAVRREVDPFAEMDPKPGLMPPLAWEVEPFTEAQL